MERTPPRPMTPFDELVTPPFLYNMKLLLPYLPSSMQRTFGIFLKFSELRIAMSSFYGFHSKEQSFSDNILDNLKPYMNPEEQEMMDQMEGMMGMMEMMQQMQQDSDSSASPFDIMQDMMNFQENDSDSLS